ALRKLRLRADERRLALPSILKAINKNYEVRISHRDPSSLRVGSRGFNRQFVADLGSAHVRFELERVPFIIANQTAGLQSGAGANCDLCFAGSRVNLGGNAARSVARNFRLR